MNFASGVMDLSGYDEVSRRFQRQRNREWRLTHGAKNENNPDVEFFPVSPRGLR